MEWIREAFGIGTHDWEVTIRRKRSVEAVPQSVSICLLGSMGARAEHSVYVVL